MKTLLIYLLCAGVLISAPLDMKIIPYGLWPYCSDAQPEYCIPSGQEAYWVLVRPTGDDVSAFRYRITYIQGGQLKSASGIGDCVRSSAVFCSVPVVLGRVDQFISQTADELVVK